MAAMTGAVPSDGATPDAGTMLGTDITRTPGSFIRAPYTAASAAVVVTTASRAR